MKTLATLSACALLALAAPAFAQNNSDPAATGLQKNGSPNGAAGSAAKQPGKSDAGAGKHDMSEGRSSATDNDMNSTNGATNKMNPGSDTKGPGK